MVALVSIIIPVYNSEKYLERTIMSAINQTWTNIEIIIVDDGSIDKSFDVAKQFENEKLRIFRQTNKGASAARNLGLKYAKGEYIQFLDSDDLISEDKIKSQMEILNGEKDILATCATVHFNDEEDTLKEPSHSWYQTGSTDPYDFLLKLYSHSSDIPGYGGMISVHSWLTPKKLIKKAGLWNETLTVDDDGEFFCRVVLASKGIRYSYVGISYYRHFQFGKNLSARRSRSAFQSMIRAIDLKNSHMKSVGTHPLSNQIMARHYWWTGTACFPQYRNLSHYCIKTAKELGFRGEKYNGGDRSKMISQILGWKTARIISYIINGL